MSKYSVTEEFLSNLGLTETKSPNKELISELYGEGSSFYAMDCEIDTDSLENKKLFNRDNLRYSATEEDGLRAGLRKSEPMPAKFEEVKKVPEVA